MNINDALNLLEITSEVSQADIKKAYKAACLKFHPDRNPAGAKMMVAINAAYDHLKNLGDTVTPQEGFCASDYAEELHNILNQLFALNDDALEIEVCGNWVWIGGNTKPHAKALGRAGIGCKWAKKKEKWFTAQLITNQKAVAIGRWIRSAVSMGQPNQTAQAKRN